MLLMGIHLNLKYFNFFEIMDSDHVGFLLHAIESAYHISGYIWGIVEREMKDNVRFVIHNIIINPL